MIARDAVAHILKQEGVEYLFCYPTTALIESMAEAGIRPIICRQERVGLGMADGYARISNGERFGVFAMQAGPGAENAFAGVATAYSDSTPLLVLPSGYPRDRSGWPRYFTAAHAYPGVTKWLEQVNTADKSVDAMRRAISRLKNGRMGPVMVELPTDVAEEEAGDAAYEPVRVVRSAGDTRDVERAARALLDARAPVLHAGHGVLYANASDELVELAELLGAPVVTTLLGKSAFPEDHPLSLGIWSRVMTRPAKHFMAKADVVAGIGASLAKHAMSAVIPDGKTLVQITNDEADLNRNYHVEYPVLGDAKLVLAQLIDAVRDLWGGRPKPNNGEIAEEIRQVRDEWLAEWRGKLESPEAPISPYRVIWELNRTIPPEDAIVTHDSGSPRDQMVPFYRSAGPRSYIGWGKSHGLGTGLGLAMGAKLAAPEKVCINWMGDAAFGMTGLDFETAVRCNIPIITIVSNNFRMAIETDHMKSSNELYQTLAVGGNYADLARSLGGWAERVEDPAEVGPAIARARRVTEEEGKPALLEFLTAAETESSHG